MPRVRNGVAKLRKKRRLLRKAKGFRGGRGKLLRTVKETLIRGEAFATRHRRKKKGDWRGIWIVRINAACKARGINYSSFIAGLKKANIALDRKMLSELAIRDSTGFDALVVAAKDSLGKSNLPGEKRALAAPPRSPAKPRE
jgi:large subunit ribosomal protein L20